MQLVPRNYAWKSSFQAYAYRTRLWTRWSIKHHVWNLRRKLHSRQRNVQSCYQQINVCDIIFRFLLVEESKIASKLTTSAHGLGLINRTTILKLAYELEFCKFRIVDEIHEITSLKAHLPYILYFPIKSFELQMLQLILWQSRPSLLNRVSSHSHVTWKNFCNGHYSTASTDATSIQCLPKKSKEPEKSKEPK